MLVLHMHFDLIVAVDVVSYFSRMQTEGVLFIFTHGFFFFFVFSFISCFMIKVICFCVPQENFFL